MLMSDTLYRERILDHYRDPRHEGELDGADVEAERSNTSCGDRVTFYLAVEDDTVTGVGFTASGCAITVASASILAEDVAGSRLQEVAALTEEDMLELLGGDIAAMREDCALLPYRVLQQAIERYTDT